MNQPVSDTHEELLEALYQSDADDINYWARSREDVEEIASDRMFWEKYKFRTPLWSENETIRDLRDRVWQAMRHPGREYEVMLRPILNEFEDKTALFLGKKFIDEGDDRSLRFLLDPVPDVSRKDYAILVQVKYNESDL